MSEDKKHNDRRRFLDAAVRWPLLGAVGLLAGRLAAQNMSGPLHPDETCSSAGVCRGCRTLAACRSPQADLFRRYIIRTGATGCLPTRVARSNTRLDKQAVAPGIKGDA